MTTHYSKLSPESISFLTSKEENIKVNDGDEIKYSTIKFSYDHEDDDGNITAGDLKFELPEVNIPYGLTLEKGYNLKGRFEFPRDSEEPSNCVSSKARTQIKGWVRKEDVEVDMDDSGKNIATTDKDIDVVDKPNDEAKIIDKISGESGEIMTVIGKSPDKKYFSIVYGGQDGFFELIRKAFVDIIYENRNKKGIEFGDKTKDEILKSFTDPVYISKDKTTGNILDKNPAIYFNVIYYPFRNAQGDKPARKEVLADFDIPGETETLTLEQLKTHSIKCIPTVKIMHVTKTGSRLSMKMYVTYACVTDIDEIKTTRVKNNTYNKYSNNKKIVENMKLKMSKIRINEEKEEEKEDAPKTTKEAETSYNKSTQDEEKLEDFNLDKMLNDNDGVFN